MGGYPEVRLAEVVGVGDRLGENRVLQSGSLFVYEGCKERLAGSPNPYYRYFYYLHDKSQADAMETRQAGSNVTRELLDVIGGAIVGGDFETGATLPTEAAMSDRYSASRTVTREAIKMLTAKGLVRSWPRRGTIVQQEQQWNLLDPDVLAWILDRRASVPILKDFLIMRLAIEPAAASLAAEIRADTAEIETALQFMKRANDGIGDPLQADSAFHAAVLRASGNRFFAQMAPLVDTALRMSIRLTNRLKGVRAASVDDHESILIAIQKHQKQRAFRETRALIDEALTLVRTQLEVPTEIAD